MMETEAIMTSPLIPMIGPGPGEAAPKGIRSRSYPPTNRARRRTTGSFCENAITTLALKGKGKSEHCRKVERKTTAQDSD